MEENRDRDLGRRSAAGGCTSSGYGRQRPGTSRDLYWCLVCSSQLAGETCYQRVGRDIRQLDRVVLRERSRSSAVVTTQGVGSAGWGVDWTTHGVNGRSLRFHVVGIGRHPGIPPWQLPVPDPW